VPERALLVITVFVGLAALGGAAAALPSAPNVCQILAPLQRWPLADFFFADLAGPRVFLLLIVGRRKPWPQS
jgi:hypothetical protein